MSDNFARAPYNFIPFPKKVHYRYTSLDQAPKHNIYDQNRLSGYIKYVVDTKTPLFISNGESEKKDELDFFNIDGNYCIPGSTIKGKLRSNCEVLSNSYPEFIHASVFSYREVASRSKSSIKKDYESYIKTDQKTKINKVVKVGLLVNTNESFKIYPFEAIKNYDDSNNQAYFQFLRDNALKNCSNYKINKHALGDRNYKPYALLCKKEGDFDISNKISSSSLNRDVEVTDIVNKELNFTQFKSKLEENSYAIEEDKDTYFFLMNSNKMYKKQNHYIFNANISNSMPLDINSMVLAEYKSRLKNVTGKTEYGDSQKSDFNSLPSKDMCKPCFYITDDRGRFGEKDSVISIGFTPYMRLPYRYTVKEGIRLKEDKRQLDYASALFGTTDIINQRNQSNNTSSYKSRLKFENASIVEFDDDNVAIDNRKLKDIKKMLLSPKPTSFQLYLKQTKNDIGSLKHYNSYITRDGEEISEFELRGRKFYWLKDDADISSTDAMKSPKSASTLRPFEKGTKFEGKIHFENLSKDEIGLLLYSLRIDEGTGFREEETVFYDSLGQGKPYGFGRVEFKIKEIGIMDVMKRYEDNTDGIKIYSDSMHSNIEINQMNSDIGKDHIQLKHILSDYRKSYVEYYNKYIDDTNYLNHINNEMIWMYKLSKSLCPIYDEKKLLSKDISEFEYMGLQEFKQRESLKNLKTYLDEDPVRQMLLSLGGNSNVLNKQDESNMSSEWIFEEISVLVISGDQSSSNKMKLNLREFNKIEFIDIDSINRKYKNIVNSEIIVFNNLDGSKGSANYIAMAKLIKEHSSKGYFYYNDQNIRCDKLEAEFFNFASTPITVRSNIIDLIRYWRNMNE